MYDYPNAGLTTYISRVNRTPKLEREEERALAVKWQKERDKKAANRLIEAHLPFVVAMAKRYQRYNVPLADLIGEGNFALLEAIDRYEPERDLRFVTYAAFWVRARIVGVVLRNFSVARSGRGALKSRIFFKLRRERAKSLNRFGESEAAIADVANSLAMPVEKVRDLLRQLDNTDVSMDMPTGPEGRSLLDTLSAEDVSQETTFSRSQQSSFQQELVSKALLCLDTRERYIAEARLLSDTEAEVTLAEIGRRLGISRERVRQLEERAKAKLRNAVERIGVELGQDPREALCAA
ncbi:MAG: sigma-70 family RNA polymerase sigma factor [Polyangiaceae bacterium]|nr:sigma-70 family RNA polymerase sigma factor [Polyangiaceae bacterium]